MITITDFSSEGKSIVGDDFTLQIYPLDNPVEEKSTVSSLSLGNCENILKREYNLPLNESLLISKMDVADNTSLTPKVQYFVYSSLVSV